MSVTRSKFGSARRRLRRVLDNLPVATCLLGMDGEILWGNRAVLDSFGGRPRGHWPARLGLRGRVRISAGGEAELREICGRAARGEASRADLTLEAPDGPLEANVSYWSGGGLYFTFLRDITDRKLAEQKLLDRELQIRSLGDNLPDAVVFQYTRDPDGSPRFVYMSAGVEQICGVRAEDAIRDASLLFRQIPPEFVPRYIEAEAASARELSVFDIELPILRPDGESRWIRIRSRPRRLPGGEIRLGRSPDRHHRAQEGDGRGEEPQCLAGAESCRADGRGGIHAGQRDRRPGLRRS